jgi:hypothetical protein
VTHPFQERAVGFLDVLGFKQLLREAESGPAGFTRLAQLRAVLDSHVYFDNASLATSVPNELKPRYIFVSDSIILSVPLRHAHKNLADGLGIVAIKTIQIAQKVLELGLLVRGGISTGKVWHDDRNIFGSGYVSAYGLEQRARHPRIMLSSEAADLWRYPARIERDLCIPDGDHLIVDVLKPYYLRETSAQLPYEPYFHALSVRISNNLQEMPPGSPEREKWAWMAGFFNEAIVRHQINVASLSVPKTPLCVRVSQTLGRLARHVRPKAH